MKKIYIAGALNVAEFKQNIQKRFDKDWIDYRIDIFMKYTLQSLKAQTNQNFTAVFMYLDETENTVLESLSRHEKLPGNVKFIQRSNYRASMRNEVKDYEHLYLVRLDTDDMYHKTFVQQLHDINPKEETLALINQDGYLYNTVDKFLIKWGDKSPNYYTIIYPTKDLLTGNLYKYKVTGGHSSIIELPHEILSKRNFIRTMHENNTIDYSGFTASDKMAINQKSEVQKVLFEFIGDSAYRM